MRFRSLAVLAFMAVDAALGLIQSSEGPLERSVFADEVSAVDWAAAKFTQLHTRSLSIPSPFSLHAREEHLPARLRNVTEADLRKAREIVEQAIEQTAILNLRRLENPLRNNYQLKDGTKIYGRDVVQQQTHPLLAINEEIADAAALVAEADAFGDDLELDSNSTISTTHVKSRQSSGFWMEGMAHQGAWPWGKNSPDFKVFRNVKDYGAKGDGKTDDTKAIRKAIEESGMCGDGCYSSTTHGAIIYFPSGTYLVSSTIEKFYGTQLIGNPNDRPIMKASKFFVGLGIFSTNKYYGDDQQDEAKQDHAWYINTGIFWGQIRNFVIDISGAYKKVVMTGLHYQVSQATSLQYVDFKASTDTDAKQRAIFAENGSGGHMSDLTFTGGQYGIYGGNQQFTGQRLTFTNVQTAVQLVWDWGWTWKSVVIDGSETAFKLVSEDASHGIGGALIVDSLIKNTKTAVAIFSPTKELGKGTTGLTLDNVRLESVQVLIDEMSDDGTSVRTDVVDSGTKGGGNKDIELWVLGRSYQNNTLGTDMVQETIQGRAEGLVTTENPLGLPKPPFFERAKPQYETAAAADFVSTKSAGCKGDGSSDDRSCLQGVIDDAALAGKIVFIDAGTYIVQDTLHIPPGSRIVGENWAQIAATGSNFGDETQPRPLIRVGNAGDKGVVEMQDLIITSKGETPGTVFIEWNIEAEGPGKAGMWEVHIRVGGTDGSGLISSTCPPARSGVPPGCKGGSMMMHLTSSGSAYIENAWYWVADHDLDDPTWADNNNKMTQTSVYVARGFLVESTKPSWLYGTSSEHSVFYQYQFSKASNVLAGMIQSEQPYYQPTPPAPAPFEMAVGIVRGDPPFQCTEAQPCDSGWGLRIIESSDITILGAGLYSWFSTYSQDCLTTSSCQRVMAELAANRGDIVIHNLVTIGAENMVRSDTELISAKDNRAVDFHPYWSQLSRFRAREFPKPVSSQPVVEHGDDVDPTEALTARLQEVCSRGDSCIPLTIPSLMCGSGYTMVGYDQDGCLPGPATTAKPICCKTAAAPTACEWRANPGGVASDCVERCEAGEVPLFDSKDGGGPKSDSGNACERGRREFCCKHPGFDRLTAGCEWVKQGGCWSTHSCPGGKQSVATRVIEGFGPQICLRTEDLCCPVQRTQLGSCHWVGQEDCADSKCASSEITVDTNFYGDAGIPCNWQRKKSLCCTPEFKPPQPVCGRPVCETDPFACLPDLYALGDDDEDENFASPELFDDSPARRAVADENDGVFADIEARASGRRPDDPGPPAGAQRSARVDAPDGTPIFLYARNYDGASRAYGQPRGPRPNTFPLAFRPAGAAGGCRNVEAIDIASVLTNGPNSGAARYEEFERDHRIELQYMRDLVRTALWGELVNGTSIRSIVTPIPGADFEYWWNWNNQNLPDDSQPAFLRMRRVTPTSPRNRRSNLPHRGMLSVNNRLFELLGASTNNLPIVMLELGLNGAKGRVFQTRYTTGNAAIQGRTAIFEDGVMTDLRDRLENGDMEQNPGFLQRLNDATMIWRYINHPQVLPGIQQIRRDLRAEIQQLEATTVRMAPIVGRRSLAGLTAIFDLFDQDWWEEAAEHTRNWVEGHLNTARDTFRASNSDESLYILEELETIWRETLRSVQAPPPP